MSEVADHDDLRRLFDRVLLSTRENCAGNFFNEVGRAATQAGVAFDGAVVLEHWSDLVRTGMLAVPGDVVGGSHYTVPRMLVTAKGRRFLELGEQSPHNPSKYLAAVRRRISLPDEIAVSYLAEAVEAWRCGLYRSSAVMLGCACERLVLMLAEAIAGSPLAEAEKVRKSLEGRVFVSGLFDLIRSTLERLKAEKRLPHDLGDALDRKLSAIFDHARALRNESGHPTGEEVSAEDAEAGLLLFPGFYERVDKLISWLAELPACPAAGAAGQAGEGDGG